MYAWGRSGSGKQGGRGAGQTKGTWLRMDPDELNGIHRYNVRLSPSTPSNEIIQIRSIGEKHAIEV